MLAIRTFGCIGAGTADRANLRDSLCAAAGRLRDAWQWGGEARADLLLLDACSPDGAAALARARQRGLAHALLIDADAAAPDGRYLRRPFRIEELASLLNGVQPVSPAMGTASEAENARVFQTDLGPAATVMGGWLERVERCSRGSIDHGQARRNPPGVRAPAQPPSPTIIDPEAGRADGRSTIVQAVPNPFLVAGRDDTVPCSGFHDPEFRRATGSHFRVTGAHPLAAYLRPGALGGPAVIQLAGAPELMLDPKQRVFHTAARLVDLEPYFRQPLPQGSWKRLVTTDLAGWRESTTARPYLRLLWTDRFLTSGGQLARHLDLGGLFRLKRWMELGNEFPRAFRIAANMTVPRQLGDIARAGEACLAEVIDVVNAYDAIGFLECMPRRRTVGEGRS